MIPLVVLSSHVMFASPAYDHGLYHLQVVSWLNQYAIVPGLGNLHHRLAFNNSNLLCAALINWGLFADRAYYLSTTMPAFMLILAGGNGFFPVISSSQAAKNFTSFLCLDAANHVVAV